MSKITTLENNYAQCLLLLFELLICHGQSAFSIIAFLIITLSFIIRLAPIIVFVK